MATAGENLNADQLQRALEASMARAKAKKTDLDITSEEAENLKKAFQKPEFRDLFNDYLQEISDPKNRKEYDDYLEKLEKQGNIPKNVNLVRPTAGFCVKVRTLPKAGEESRKVFVNVCSSDSVDVPEATPVTKNGRTGQNWTLPHFVGPQRVEQDKKKQACETFDVCFHPSAVLMAEHTPGFKDMLARTSLDAVVKAVHKVRQSTEFAVDIDNYHVLVGRKCIGEKPAALNVPTSKKSAKVADIASVLSGNSSSGKQTTGHATNQPKSRTNKKSEGSWSKKGFLNSKKNNKKTKKDSGQAGGDAQSTSQPSGKPLIKEVSKEEADKKRQEVKRNDDGTLQPLHTLVHRGTLELANYMTDLTHAPKTTRPKELVVNISLPAISSARTVDLDVSETHLKVRVPKIYSLCIELPFPVQDEEGKAKFDKTKRELVVTLPVQVPTYTEEQLRTPLDDGEADGTEDAANAELGKEDADDNSVDDADYVLVEAVDAENSNTNSHPYLNSDAQQQLEKEHSDLSAEIARRAAEAVEKEKARIAALPQAVDDYVSRQTAAAVTILIPSTNIVKETASVNFESQSVVATFAVETVKDNSETVEVKNFQLKLNLWGKINTSQSRFSVSSKNMVLILTKEEQGLWDQIEGLAPPVGEADGFVDPESNEGEDASVNVEKFVAAEKYSGRRKGCVFRNGIKGLGYYKDTGPFTCIDSQFSDEEVDAVHTGGDTEQEGNAETEESDSHNAGQIETRGTSDSAEDNTINVFENNYVFELD